jgi:hypothetical protein
MSQTGSLLERLGAFAASAALVLPPAVALGQAGAPGASGAPSAGQSNAASDESFFLPFIERRFVIVQHILLPYAVLIDVPPATSEESHFVALNLGTLYGFADRWMVDAVVAPLVLSDSFRYGNPELGLAYQVVDSRPFELGVTARAFFSSTGVVFSGVEPGVAALFRFGHARLDVGAWLPISTSGQSVGVLGARRVGLRVPVIGSYQLDTHFHVALNTGASFGDLGEAGDSLAMPLGITGGWSTNVHGYWVDVLPFFSFPAFYGRGGVNTDVMSLGLILDFSKKL